VAAACDDQAALDDQAAIAIMRCRRHELEKAQGGELVIERKSIFGKVEEIENKFEPHPPDDRPAACWRSTTTAKNAKSRSELETSQQVSVTTASNYDEGQQMLQDPDPDLRQWQP